MTKVGSLAIKKPAFGAGWKVKRQENDRMHTTGLRAFGVIEISPVRGSHRVHRGPKVETIAKPANGTHQLSLKKEGLPAATGSPELQNAPEEHIDWSKCKTDF